MKIGILACGSVPADIRGKFPGYPDMIMQAFTEIGCQYVYKTFDANNLDFPEKINECDVYIITGSSASVNDGFDWIDRLESFVLECKKQEKKMVGICFGHQIMAKALGGTVSCSASGWGIGLIESRILKNRRWINPARNYFNMIINHHDEVLDIPEHCVLIASNDHCKNFMIKYDDNLLGIQGHPEFDREYSRALMTVNRDIIPEERLEYGYATLARNLDKKLVMRWINRFLTTKY